MSCYENVMLHEAEDKLQSLNLKVVVVDVSCMSIRESCKRPQQRSIGIFLILTADTDRWWL